MTNRNVRNQVDANTDKLRRIADSGNSNDVFKRISHPALATGGNSTIRAACTADAGAGSTIAATLYASDGTTGSAITVHCNISNGSALNAATPRLEDGDDIFVTLSNFDNAGTPEPRYYCVSNFQATEICTCGA